MGRVRIMSDAVGNLLRLKLVENLARHVLHQDGVHGVAPVSLLEPRHAEQEIRGLRTLACLTRRGGVGRSLVSVVEGQRIEESGELALPVVVGLHPRRNGFPVIRSVVDGVTHPDRVPVLLLLHLDDVAGRRVERSPIPSSYNLKHPVIRECSFLKTLSLIAITDILTNQICKKIQF